MSQPSPVVSPKKNLKTTLILFLSIVIGIFLFMLAAVLIGQTRGPLMPELNKQYTVFITGLIAVSFVCLLSARYLLAKGITSAKNSLNPLNEKLNLHRATLIKYLVLCEVPVMLSIILFLLTGNFVFEIFAAVFIGFMLSVAPTKKRVAEQLELDRQQQSELE